MIACEMVADDYDRVTSYTIQTSLLQAGLDRGALKASLRQHSR